MPGSGLAIIPSCLLLIMQTHYYHLMLYNAGLVLLLFFFLFLIVVSREKTGDMYIALTFFPVLYYLAGAFGLIFARDVHCLQSCLPERTPQVSNAADACRPGRIMRALIRQVPDYR